MEKNQRSVLYWYFLVLCRNLSISFCILGGAFQFIGRLEYRLLFLLVEVLSTRPTAMNQVTLRKMTKEDKDHIMALQEEGYVPKMREDWVVFERKIVAYPEGCYLAFLADKAVGYLFSHPWNTSSPVPLNDSSFSLPKELDCYYIHDVVVDRSCRGKGIAKKLLGCTTDEMKKLNFTTMALVAIGEADSFWRKFGFQEPKQNEVQKSSEEDTQKPSVGHGYPEDISSIYMVAHCPSFG